MISRGSRDIAWRGRIGAGSCRIGIQFVTRKRVVTACQRSSVRNIIVCCQQVVVAEDGDRAATTCRLGNGNGDGFLYIGEDSHTAFGRGRVIDNRSAIRCFTLLALAMLKITISTQYPVFIRHAGSNNRSKRRARMRGLGSLAIVGRGKYNSPTFHCSSKPPFHPGIIEHAVASVIDSGAVAMKIDLRSCCGRIGNCQLAGVFNAIISSTIIGCSNVNIQGTFQRQLAIGLNGQSGVISRFEFYIIKCQDRVAGDAVDDKLVGGTAIFRALDRPIEADSRTLTFFITPFAIGIRNCNG